MTMPPATHRGPDLVVGQPADLYMELCEIADLIRALTLQVATTGAPGPTYPRQWGTFNPLLVTVQNTNPPGQLVGVNMQRVGLWLFNQSAAVVKLLPSLQSDVDRVAFVLGPNVPSLYLPGYTGALWAQSSVPNAPISIIEGMP